MPARRDVGTRSDAGARTLDGGRAQVTGEGATIAADEAEVTQRQRPRRSKKMSQETSSSRRARGDVVGRYVLLSALGEGGMGVVWAAYDPELDRRLALKLLRRGGSSERLLREAQALARLAHPNVVAIHDVGVDGGDVWLAMELVVGRTLEDWLAADPERGWRELLKVLLPAGWGVAAAHEAGLIHRDLKPANLMIGDDGRARVMDFGLARAGDLEAEVSAAEESDPLASSQVSLLGSSVTRAGAILGTPAYMPPEQFAGRADARVDVFAFAVVLWEAIYGARPFAADNLPGLIFAITQGRVQEPTTGRRAPRWLRRALLRGLAGEADARWSSMRELLTALERGLARERWRRLAMVAGVVAVIAAGLIGAWAYDRQATRSACADEAATIVALWPAQAPEVMGAIRAAGLGNAEETIERLGPKLDGWTGAWSTTREGACVDAALGDGEAAQVAAQALRCSDLQRRQLETTLDILRGGGPIVGLHALALVSQLPPPKDCLDADELRRIEPPEPALADDAMAVRAELLRARTLLVVGEYVDGLAVAEAAAARAEALGWAPLDALADFTVGLLLSRNGRFDDAEVRLRQAVRRSLVGADERIAVEAIYYLGMVTRELHAPERGLVWVEVGRALVERIEGAGGNMTAMMREVEAVLLLERDEVSLAEESAAEAVRIREAHYGADDLGMAPSLELLATIRERRGDLAGAQPISERVQAIYERAHGPNHPKVAHGLHNLGLAYLRVDDAARARPLLERALAISEQTYGKDSAKLVRLLNILGTTLSQLDEHDAAIATGERSLAISEAAFGAEHPQVAAALNNLAIAYQGAEKLDKAAELHRRALAIRVAHFGDKGDDVARSHTNLGEIAIKQGRIAAAIEHLEHAVALREAIEVSPLSLAYSRFALARAIVALDPGRAQELAKLAEDAYAAAEHPRAAEIAEWRADAAKAKRTDAKGRKRVKKRKRKGKSKKK